MRKSVLDIMSVELLLKKTDVFVRNFFGSPLIVVFGEKLDAFTAFLHTTLNGFVIPTGNRHVSP